jgi:uncharacterized protein (UPF0333 family)
MKSSVKTAFRLGVLATITIAGTAYYYLKKNNESAGDLLDRGLDSLEDAAYQANAAFKNAQSDAQNKARNVFKNVKYHAGNLEDDLEDGIDTIDNSIRNVAKDIKKNVEKAI